MTGLIELLGINWIIKDFFSSTVKKKYSDLDPEIAVDIDLGHPPVNERKEPVPGPVKSDIVIDLVLLVAAAVAVTKGAGIAPETEAENPIPKKGNILMSSWHFVNLWTEKIAPRPSTYLQQ